MFTPPSVTGCTHSEAQALIGRKVRTKHARSWIEENLLLEHHNTVTIIGVPGDDRVHEEARIRLAVQCWPPATRRRQQPRCFVLRHHGRVVERLPYDKFAPLPFVLLLPK